MRSKIWKCQQLWVSFPHQPTILTLLHMVVTNVIIDRKWGVHWEIGKCGKSTFPIRKTQLICHLCIPLPLNKAPGLSPRTFSRAQRPSDTPRRSWNMIEGNRRLWNIMETHGTLWNIMEHSGTFWNILETQNIPETHGTFQKLMEHTETLWKVMEHYGRLQNILESYGNYGN